MYKIIQCRTTETGIEVCNQIGQSGRIKEARGLVKMHFNSHLEMLEAHEMYEYWHEWDVKEDQFELIAFNINGNQIYRYRVYYDD